jgi:hypothetical protein
MQGAPFLSLGEEEPSGKQTCWVAARPAWDQRPLRLVCMKTVVQIGSISRAKELALELEP